MNHQTTSAPVAQRRQSWTARWANGWANEWANAAVVLAVALVSLLVAWGGEPWRLALRYDRLAILTGHEYWRLITGHVVHADQHHLLLNLLGLALIASLCRGCFPLRQWVIVLVCVLLAMDAGFLFAMPELVWYVGLSGALHGVLAAGALRWWQIESRWLAALLSAILVVKLAWEQWQGALPLAGDLTVIVNAHLYGALGGSVAAAGLMGYARSVRPPGL